MHRSADPRDPRIERYQLTSGASVAVRQMRNLQRQTSIATESALAIAMSEMYQIATEANPDPTIRRAVGELGLVLEINQEYRYAFTRQAADPSPHSRTILRTKTLSLAASTPSSATTPSPTTRTSRSAAMTSLTNRAVHLGQFRITPLQVINWGTFCGYKNFHIDDRGVLFTGLPGSGKSSLMDAHSLALLPTYDQRFNASADLTARGSKLATRSIADYVRGAWSETNDENEKSKGRYLRGGRIRPRADPRIHGEVT